MDSNQSNLSHHRALVCLGDLVILINEQNMLTITSIQVAAFISEFDR